MSTAQPVVVTSAAQHGARTARWRAPAWSISLAAHAALLAILAAVVAGVHGRIDPPPLRHVGLTVPMAAAEPVEPPVPSCLDPVLDVELPVVDEAVTIVHADQRVDPLPELTVPACAEDPHPEGAHPEQTGLGAGDEPGSAWSTGITIRGSHTLPRRILCRMAIRCPPGALSAVSRSLRWFKRHQNQDGRWDVDGYQANCAEGAKCEPGRAHADEAGDIACSGYALMCFLGYGYDHRTASAFRQTVKRGIAWLLSTQRPDGAFGARNYEHAVATMALCEAYAVTNDPALRAPCQRAIDVLIARQNRDASGSGLGWDYRDARPGRNDSSVSGWCVLALKSAQGAGLSVGDSLAGAKRWVAEAWKAANPGHARLDPRSGRSVFPYTWNGEDGSTAKDHLAAVGALCAVFLGQRRGDVMLDTLCNQIMATDYRASLAYPTDTYLLYYNTMAIFQASDPADQRWKDWSRDVCGMLIASQRRDQCFDGSWDFVGTGFPGHETGRLLSTAYCCLSLEVYYRKARLAP